MHLRPILAVRGAAAAFALAALAPALSACGPMIVGGAATVGVAAAQERSVGNALDDTAIQFQINQRLLETSRSLYARVGVEVVEGRVLLTGSVTTPEDRVEAVRIGWGVSGVKEVLNEIQINERGSVAVYLADVRITSQLRFQMLRDVEINDINYSVDTVNGTIYLMGIARDQAELDRVTGFARSIAGVREVVSHVRLRDDPRRV